MSSGQYRIIPQKIENFMNSQSEKNICGCQYRNQCFLCIVETQSDIR